MINKDDFIIKIKKSGTSKKMFKGTCDSCGKDRGYVDKSKAATLCRSCSRVRVHQNMSPEMKQKLAQSTSIQFIGSSPWNKGKKNVYDESLLKQWSQKHLDIMSIEENRKLSGSGKRTPWLKGKELPKEIKIKISCTHRDIDVNQFDDFKHINKNQDRRKFSYLLFSKQTFERDDYTCQKCNTKGGYLHAHHKNGFNSFPEQRFKLSNLITLCKDCHDKFHTQYGKGKNTCDQFNEFLTNIK